MNFVAGFDAMMILLVKESVDRCFATIACITVITIVQNQLYTYNCIIKYNSTQTKCSFQDYVLFRTKIYKNLLVIYLYSKHPINCISHCSKLKHLHNALPGRINRKKCASIYPLGVVISVVILLSSTFSHARHY